MEKSELRDEIIRCGRDPCYFIRKYVKIKHPVRGLIPFEMFSYQDELVRDYTKYRFNIVLKARQLGISEVTAAYATWLMLFHREKNVIVMASKAETAKNIIRKVETAIKSLPKWLVISDIITDNKLSLELRNGSRCKAIATSGDAGRSEAVSFLIVDEAAFVQRFDELWTGLYPTVQAGGAVAVLSTPNGVGNKFHQLYVDSEAGQNEFKHHKFMWWMHPERIKDLADDPDRPGYKTSPWFKNEVQSANMSPRDVAQELECCFNASGDTLISAKSIEWIEKGILQPIERRFWDRNLFVWFPPSSSQKYFVTADVARGDAKDCSAAHVWESKSMSQVAEYYGKLPPDQFARLLVDLGREYNNALLVVENNSVGLAALEHVKILMYENVYCSRKGDHKTGEAVNMQWGIRDDDLVMGFTTTQKNRPLMISKLEEFVRNESIMIRSNRFLEELKTFIWLNGRAEAMKGHNDDLTTSAAIGAWLRDTYLAPMLASSNLSGKMIDGIGLNRTLNSQIPGASKDPMHTRNPISGYNNEAVRRGLAMRMPGGKEESFSWLLPIKKG